MRVVEKVEIKLEWKDIDGRVVHPRPTYKRSTDKKVSHVMEILRYVAINNNRLKDEDRIDEMPLVVGLGMAFEDWCAGLYPTMHWQPGEVKRNGIAGNPDGLTVLNASDYGWLDDRPCVEEFKFTYKSVRKRQDIRDEWLWMQQVMAYCNLYGKPRYGRFHILWAMGDYSFPLQPKLLRYLVEFGSSELKEGWDMLIKYKEAVHAAK